MSFSRILRGDFRARELEIWLVVQGVVLWSLILFCRAVFPAENHFGLSTHSFSYLGGFEAYHNPRWWWVFAGAMAWWAATAAPVVLYLRRRFALVWRAGAWLGAVLLLLGCVGAAFVGLIPIGRAPCLGGMNYSEVHKYAGLLMVGAFCLGVVWHGILLIIDALRARRLRGGGYGRFIRLYAVFWTPAFVGAYFLSGWPAIYAAMKAEAVAAGREVPSSWKAALGTPHAVPLWENVMVCLLYVFLALLPLFLPRETPAEGGGLES